MEIRQQHQLITTGPYRLVRHPMYSVIFLWLASLGLIMANWIAWLAPVAFALFVLLRAPAEEQMMIAEYGEQYRTYMQHTGRFFPRLPG